METRDNILKELKEIAPQLALLQKPTPPQAPEGYFLNFKNNLLQQLKPVDAQQELQELAPVLARVQKPVLEPVPPQYFAAFSGEVLNKIHHVEATEELAAVAPHLNALRKLNTTHAPEGYFNAFSERVLADIRAGQQVPAGDTTTWVDAVNGLLDRIALQIFKPKYSVAFAGFATIAIMAVLMFVKVQQQCDDLDCRFAQLSTDDINSYLDNNKSDAYSDEIFEMNLDTKTLTTNPNITNVHAYKDALSDIDDQDLNAAIAE